jgi:hypothetical protein
MVLPATVLVNRSERGLLIIEQGALRAPVLVSKALCAASSRPRPPEETFARGEDRTAKRLRRYLGRKNWVKAVFPHLVNGGLLVGAYCFTRYRRLGSSGSFYGPSKANTRFAVP